MKALKKKQEYITIDEGCAGIREKVPSPNTGKVFGGNTSVDFETASYEYMKREGFLELQKGVIILVKLFQRK